MASKTADRNVLAMELAHYLDGKSSEHPVLHIDDNAGRVVASYVNVDVLLDVCATESELALVSTNPYRRFVVPSAIAAIDFITEVEAVRQGTDAPYLRFYTGLGPSSPGKVACMRRTANVCAGTTL